MLSHFREVQGEKSPRDLKEGLQREMWKTLIVEKDADTLTRAHNFIEDERERMTSDLKIADPFDLVLAFEHRNLLDVRRSHCAGCADAY